MTYTIIGGDGKEYGSTSAEDMRRWISEGRLNAQSLVKAESDAEFRPLSAFPEFASALGAQIPMPFSSGNQEGRTAAMLKIKIPAIALIVIASIGIAYYLFNIGLIATGNSLSVQNQLPADASPVVKSFIEGMNKGSHGPIAIGISAFIVALNGLMLWGAIKMLRLENYGLAITAAVIAVLPCQCCCVVGLPFGIWALVALNKPEVKAHFSS